MKTSIFATFTLAITGAIPAVAVPIAQVQELESDAHSLSARGIFSSLLGLGLNGGLGIAQLGVQHHGQKKALQEQQKEFAQQEKDQKEAQAAAQAAQAPAPPTPAGQPAPSGTAGAAVAPGAPQTPGSAPSTPQTPETASSATSIQLVRSELQNLLDGKTQEITILGSLVPINLV